MMKPKFWAAALCLGITTLLGGQRLWAAEPDKAQWEELKANMEAEGWTPIAEGVFERQRGATKVEHMTYGPKGFAWRIGELNRQLARLIREYESHPSDDLGDTIDNLKIKIASLRREMRSLPEDTASLSEAVTGGSCSNVCYSATADAYPLNTSQGTGAIADAKFNSACGYVGNAYAYAYARATTASGTQTVQILEDPVPGTRLASASATGHAEVTATGANDCYSEAYASVDSADLGIAYSTSDVNSGVCPQPTTTTSTPTTCSTKPSIIGPNSAIIRGTECKTLTWAASCESSAAHRWKIAGSEAGYGMSASRTFCGQNSTMQNGHRVVLINDTAGDKVELHFDLYYEACGGSTGAACP